MRAERPKLSWPQQAQCNACIFDSDAAEDATYRFVADDVSTFLVKIYRGARWGLR
jgi:hypothetical protein